MFVTLPHEMGPAVAKLCDAVLEPLAKRAPSLRSA